MFNLVESMFFDMIKAFEKGGFPSKTKRYVLSGKEGDTDAKQRRAKRKGNKYRIT